ncbi:hypothetical protein AVEN_159725-1 [Araneus ventricosus]|uniref:Uncharacterized protein n=1 Tax=Araneus ventricosus TaxID=182803 RepID=A0A4Y2JVW9_ARAVE|nr:hypothetical protein AVEN_159725-1 [Araneus ventricosus]
MSVNLRPFRTTLSLGNKKKSGGDRSGEYGSCDSSERARNCFESVARHPPAHSWYRSEGPGAAIRVKGDRRGQTALARLSSCHLKTLRFPRGDKKFNICTKCNMIEATQQHLLDCVTLVYYDLLMQPYFVLEVMKANDLMDLI